MWKRWVAAAGLLVAVGLGAWHYLPDAPTKVEEGAVAPDFMLKDLNGVARGLPKGEVVLLNFWATWCPPCRQEMPSMVSLYQRLKDHGLKVVAVSVDRNLSDLTGFVREYGIPFEVLHDADASVSHRYGVYRYPETFIIDRTGRVRTHVIGMMNWMDPVVVKALQAMLIEKPKG